MLPMFYKNITALRAEHHQDICVEPLTDHSFAGQTNAIVLGVSEFSPALVQYPIVFVKSGDKVTPAAVTGLRDQQNLFVDGKGQWSEGYIPAYVRRYPFVVAAAGDKQLTVCIDEGYSGINRGQRGEPLFEGGQHSAYLKRVIGFLEGFEAEFSRTRNFCLQLVELDLLEETRVNMSMTQAEQEDFALSGFLAVSRDKLAKLPADTLKQLQLDGGLELIYRHLASLSRFDDLFKRIVRT
ncbi:MAG: hypothetical protein ACJAWL_002807 [Motiliproteus sp.]|jgi:hypothetical protein